MHTDNKPQEELDGMISVQLQSGKTVDDFCQRHFTNYNKDQFEMIALRLYYGKEIIVTLYALDKYKQEETNFYYKKMPVKKFKTSVLTMEDVLSYIQEFNFTLTSENYSLDNIEVINK
jgi:hypothetical protein